MFLSGTSLPRPLPCLIFLDVDGLTQQARLSLRYDLARASKHVEGADRPSEFHENSLPGKHLMIFTLPLLLQIHSTSLPQFCSISPAMPPFLSAPISSGSCSLPHYPIPLSQPPNLGAFSRVPPATKANESGRHSKSNPPFPALLQTNCSRPSFLSTFILRGLYRSGWHTLFSSFPWFSPAFPSNSLPFCHLPKARKTFYPEV